MSQGNIENIFRLESEAILARLRELGGIRQSDIARALGVSAQAISAQKEANKLDLWGMVQAWPKLDWGYILTGQSAKGSVTVEDALKTLRDAGFKITIE